MLEPYSDQTKATLWGQINMSVVFLETDPARWVVLGVRLPKMSRATALGSLTPSTTPRYCNWGRGAGGGGRGAGGGITSICSLPDLLLLLMDLQLQLSLAYQSGISGLSSAEKIIIVA